MSDIPKSERSESRLEAQHKAYKIRKMITAELMASFAYSEKKHEKHIQAMTEHIKNEEERKATAQKIRELEEDFDFWFIRKERERILDFTQGIASHLRAANTIWPTYKAEFVDRRLEMDKVDPITLPGRKMLKKGVDIGSQPSQNIGIVYPYRIDNYAKIVKGAHGYARYTDDFHAIHESKEFLEELLEGIRRIAEEYGLIINEKKTRIVRLDSFFCHLQIGYSLQKNGRLIRKINPKAITRERQKLKAYKRMLDKDEMPYEDIENAFKGWMGGNYKRMSRKQITNMFVLYYQLFERRPTWKKRHGRLRWLMVQSLKTFS